MGGRKAAMVCQLPFSYNGILRINTVRGIEKVTGVLEFNVV